MHPRTDWLFQIYDFSLLIKDKKKIQKFQQSQKFWKFKSQARVLDNSGKTSNLKQMFEKFKIELCGEKKTFPR